MWQPKMFMILCFNFPFHQRFRSHINNEQLFLHEENKKVYIHNPWMKSFCVYRNEGNNADNLENQFS